jgi:5-methylcytosine-specific restriction enzyme A
MSRKEFPAKVKVAAFLRSQGHCEMCGVALTTGKFHYDHELPDALGGEPTLENCKVACTPCHSEKTAKEDVPRIRKADRQRKAHIGAKAPVKRKIQSAGFPKAQRTRIEKQTLPPRSMFR